uniref:Secreted protein n=1 Tax=Anopheles christyi TaxID=43041 RepID=A0A182KDM9_9DIPT
MRVLVTVLLMLVPVGLWTPASCQVEGQLINPGWIVLSEASKALLRIAFEVAEVQLGDNKPEPLNLNQDRRILHTIHTLSAEMRESQVSMTEILGQRMQDVVESFGNRNRFIERLEKLYTILRLIERREASMYMLLRTDLPVEQLTLTQFAAAVVDVSKSDSVIELLHNLEMVVTGSNLALLPSGQQDIFAQLNEVPLYLSTVLATLLLFSSLPAATNARNLHGASPVDAMRHRYLQQERLAWTIVNQIDAVDNQLEQDANQQRATVMRELVDIYLRFVETELDQDDRGDYRLLGRLSEWHMLEQNLMTVNKLFTVVYAFLRDNAPRFAEQADLAPEDIENGMSSYGEDLRLLTIDLAETILFDKRQPIALQLDQIYTIMVRQALYYRASLTAKSVLCSFGLSPQQLMYVLYESIATTELKGYIMMQFSYMLLKTQGKGNFTVESHARRNELQTRLARTQQLVKSVMNQTSSEYWRCDPDRGNHRENVTYVQFTRLIQGYIENEVDMTTDNTCRESCAHYKYGHEQHQCFQELYCSKQPKCAGRIYDCEYIDSDMWICPAAPGSIRRYEYIEYENGEVRGRKQHCPRGTTKVDSWWRWVFWHCSYCFCYCDDAGRHSDRYVSLRESVSDVQQNRVVTGVRFVKRNQMVHLIVQQGLLLPGGEIANDTLEWVVPQPFRHTDKGMRDGTDYHTLSYDRRAIDLDDVTVPDGFVVTGVQLRMVGTHLNLVVRMTEMNFTSGQLIDLQNTTIWGGNIQDDRKEMLLKYMDVPTLAPSKSTPDSLPSQYLRFGPSGGRADAAQTTI